MDMRGLGFLLAIVLLPSVLGLCQVSSPTGDDALLNVIYTSEGINYGTDLLTPTPPATVEVERNATIITDPASGTYRVVDLPSRAIDVEKTPLFIKNKSIQEGPFFVAGILDDTLRVAKGEPYDYGYGLKLHDRYEGRAEVNPISTASEASQFLSTLLSILSQPRVKNVLRTEDFTVTITCASSLCDKRAYSLFARLMNLGASTQMFTEWFGMAAFNFFVPKSWKLKFTERMMDVKFELAEKLKNYKKLRQLLRLPTADELLDETLRKLDNQTKGMLLAAITEGDAFNLHEISLGEGTTVDLATYLTRLDVEKRRTFLQAVDALSAKLDLIKKKLEKAKELVSKNKEEAKKIFREADEEAGKIAKYFGLTKPPQATQPTDLESLIERYLGKSEAALKNISTIREETAKTLPLTSTLSEVIRDYTSRGIEPRTEKGRALLRESIAPVFYYLIKRGLAPVERIPSLAAPTPGFLGFMLFGWRVSEPYQIPPEWRTIVIKPAESHEYGDAFVDFIINRGVDPGDAFKSFVSITPVCLIGHYWEYQQGSAPPFLSELCVTQRSERVYEPKEAILGLGVASSTCPTCSLSVRGNALTLDVGGATASAFLLENSRESEGSLSVAFAHHTNIKMGDEAELDLDEAKQRGETCMQKCPIIRNPFYTLGGLVKDPRGAMFVASTVQSLVYMAPLPIAVIADVTILTPQAAQCHACVDDVGGYYLHVFAPHTTTEDTVAQSPESSLSSAVDKILSTFSLDKNSVLAQKLEGFKEYLRTSEIKKEAVVSNVVLEGMSSGELRFSSILVLWSKAEEMVPTGLHNQESVDVATPGGTFSIDTDRGELRFNGAPIMQGDRVRLYVINNRVPGIVFPGKLVYTSFSGEAFEASSRKDYAFLDPDFISCVSNAFGCKNIKECFGDLVEVHTDRGVIKAREKGLDIFGDEAVAGTHVRVVGYRVFATAADFVPEENAGGVKSIAFSSREINMGYLNSLVFQNGIIVRDGSRLIVWIEVLNAVPGGAVDSVHLDWNADAQGVDVTLTPSPDASKEEMENIERMNKLLDEIEPIRAVDAEKTAVAIVKDENGNLWLRIYNKDANVVRTDLMRSAKELLSTLVSMPSTIKLIETNTWSLRIYRDEKGQLRIQFTGYDGNTWDEKLLSVVRDPEDPMAVKIITDSGEHVLRARYEKGLLLLSLDGLEGYVTNITGASVVSELIHSVGQDPEDPNKLLIETEKGKHVVEIKVSRDGTPYLTLDGENKGAVNTLQGAKGFLWFDPTEGWKLVNGALLPLADAFKNGIKIAIGGDGLVHGEPSSGVVVFTPSQQGQQGFVLPLFEGWEKVFVVLSLAAILFVVNLRARG